MHLKNNSQWVSTDKPCAHVCMWRVGIKIWKTIWLDTTSNKQTKNNDDNAFTLK